MPKLLDAHLRNGLGHDLHVIVVQSAPEARVGRPPECYEVPDGHLLDIGTLSEHHAQLLCQFAVGVVVELTALDGDGA